MRSFRSLEMLLSFGRLLREVSTLIRLCWTDSARLRVLMVGFSLAQEVEIGARY